MSIVYLLELGIDSQGPDSVRDISDTVPILLEYGRDSQKKEAVSSRN